MTTVAAAVEAPEALQLDPYEIPFGCSHDFPYRICAVCRFPILPTDLVDDDFRPCHRSTCHTTDTQHRDDAAGAASVQLDPNSQRRSDR